MCITLIETVAQGLIDELSPEDYLCCGSMSVIYTHETRVRRATTCGGSHHALTLGHRLGLDVPICYRDFGAVAEIMDGSFLEKVWLAELERLEPLQPQSLQWQQVDAICEALGGDDIYHAEALAALPVEALIALDLPESLTRTVLAMITHTQITNGILDLNPSNFMVRPSTGEVLVTDLVSSVALWDQRSVEELAAAGFSPEQLFGIAEPQVLLGSDCVAV